MPFHRMSRAARVHRVAIVPILLTLSLVAASKAGTASQAHGPPDFEQFHAQPEQVDQPEQSRKPEQISEYVREVFQDRDGVFWFGTNGDGLARFDGESLTYISVDDGLAGIAIRGILQSPDGALWFATESGVSRYASGTFTNYTTDDGLSNNSIWSIMQDSAGTIWVGTHAGVCRFDGVSFVPFPLPRVEVANPESRFSPLVVFAMFEDRAGNLWFGTDGEGAHRYDGAAFTSYTAAEGLAGNMVRAITGDRHGNIWLGTNGDGASRFDGTSFTTFTSTDGLNNDRIYEIFEDSAGNIWFSTLGTGASRFDGTSFTAFREDHDLIINDRPARTHVQEFFEDKDGVLWIGCSGGLFYFDGETFVNVTRSGPWPDPRREPARTTGIDNASPPADPSSLEGWPAETFPLPPGFAPGLPTGRESLRFAPGWRDPATEDFWSYAFVMWIDEPAPGAARVRELLEDYYNGLMDAFSGDREIETPARVEITSRGPHRFEAQMHLIDAFATFEPIDLRVLIDTAPLAADQSTLRVRISPQPAEHTIWKSLDAAVRSILSQDESGPVTGETLLDDPAAIIIPPANLLSFGYGTMPGGRANGGVRSILEDSNGNYWFGSWMEGVARFDGESLTYFTEKDGLSDNQVRTIFEDRNGVIWFECGKGISSFDGKEIVTHTHRDYTATTAWRLEPGDLWFKSDEMIGFNANEQQSGAYRYDGERFTYLTFPFPEDRNSEPGYSVTGTARGQSGRLWFATYQAVIGYDGESFTIIDNESLGLTEQTGYLHARCVFEDSKGRLWIGNNGIGVILRDGDTTTNFTQQQGVGRRDSRSGGGTAPQPGDANAGTASLHRVFSIGEDRDGNIWFGTVEQGAWRYDGQTLRNFSEADGLTSKGIMAIYNDSRGHLLLGGNGVFRFNGETFERVH